MEILESSKSSTTEILQLVSFIIGNEEYAVNIFYVKEINRLSHITKVPNAPEFIEGVINLRGRIIPVIDLRIKIGLPKKGFDKDSRIIVIEDEDLLVGFLVDAVKEVIRIPKNIIEEPPEIVTSSKTDFISSVGKLEDRLLILIDLKKILSKNEQNKLKEVA
ncbi:Chemotaxis signal transduction protein [Ignavibacterium album JCM 16511]|uniref:Chemotaxis protein CheW n=1 Tax=Ignavibacterium album (strain DSM 19864 / JCM 16511 / NBRC 101810 / Mat9-16) TaxID=945713 RepID=I0AMQ4_IGNAJ|nr:chemotaxis protein CheW [Ignavibacterium album]AFH50261.1 Chemotaxis signal transduction protein [Ignavibacterium album JCM 16511]